MESVCINLLQFEDKGWRIDLFVDSYIRNEYLCFFCANICKDAVELSCDVNHDDGDIQLYCKNCLISVIESNNNNCPLDNHSNPKYSPTRRIRGKINSAQVFCPNSLRYKQAQIKLNKNDVNGNIDTDTKEGVNDNNYNNQKGCNFDGVLTDLMKHISKCCESQSGSKEVQFEMFKLLKSEIKILKDDINDLKKVNQQQNCLLNTIKESLKLMTLQNDQLKEENNASNKIIAELKQGLNDLRKQKYENQNQIINDDKKQNEKNDLYDKNKINDLMIFDSFGIDPKRIEIIDNKHAKCVLDSNSSTTNIGTSIRLKYGISTTSNEIISWKITHSCTQKHKSCIYFVGVTSNRTKSFQYSAWSGLTDAFGISPDTGCVFKGNIDNKNGWALEHDSKFKQYDQDSIITIQYNPVTQILHFIYQYNKNTMNYELKLLENNEITHWYPTISLRDKNDICTILM